MQKNQSLWAHYSDTTPFKQSEWSIDRKVVDDLKNNPFDGDLSKYRDWHDLLRDNLLGSNQGYGRVIYEIERETHPIPFARIQANPTMPGMSCDLLWITRQLGTFPSGHVTK